MSGTTRVVVRVIASFDVEIELDHPATVNLVERGEEARTSVLYGINAADFGKGCTVLQTATATARRVEAVATLG